MTDCKVEGGTGVKVSPRQAGGAFNITMRNLVLDGRLSSLRGVAMEGLGVELYKNGGHVSHLLFENIQGQNLTYGVKIYVNSSVQEIPSTVKRSVVATASSQIKSLKSVSAPVSHVQIRNIMMRGIFGPAGVVHSEGMSPMRHLQLENIRLESSGKGWVCAGRNFGRAYNVEPKMSCLER